MRNGYIANDGTFFEDKSECIEHEQNEIIDILQKYSVRDLDDLVPYGREVGDPCLNTFDWFKVETEEEVEQILKPFGLLMHKRDVILPDYICIENVNGCNNQFYFHSLRGFLMNDVRDFFNNFSYDVTFTERERKL